MFNAMQSPSIGVTQIGTKVFADKGALAQAAADAIIRQLQEKPDSVLCLPTGRTPILTYQILGKACEAGRVSFKHATIFNVDEYVGLDGRDAASFASYMQKHLFDHIDVSPDRTFIPDGRADSPALEAKQYEDKIAAAGGIDFMMLGVGGNGHIGFNEPGSQPDSVTRVVELAPQTLSDNADDLPQNFVPTHAITIGISTIISAKQVFLLASGPAKKAPLSQLFSGGDAMEWPVAILAEHKDLIVYMDEQAVPEDA